MNPSPAPPTAVDTWDLDPHLFEEDTQASASVDQLWQAGCDEGEEEPWLFPDDETQAIGGPGFVSPEAPTTAYDRGRPEPTWYPDALDSLHELDLENIE